MSANWAVVERIAAFLMKEKGSVLATWTGRMTYAEQRKLFGTVFGKGKIVIDGAQEEVYMLYSIPFARDTGIKNLTTFRELVY